MPLALRNSGILFLFNDVLLGNINSVILSLMANTTAKGFANSTYGAGDNAVYGISECRGDITGQACSECISAAAQQVHAKCPNTPDAQIWFQTCYLRTSVTNFIGQANSTKVGAWFSGVQPVNPAAFIRAVNELMFAMGSAAAYGENRKFGWGKIEDSQLAEKVMYGMVQCSWDLTDSECVKCFSDALAIRTDSCKASVGCFVITNSCWARYEAGPFLLTQSDPAVPTRAITVSNL